MTDEELAKLFHETYERLAPSFGYKTREASAKPWADVPEQNRALMTATVREVRTHLGDPMVVIDKAYAESDRQRDAATILAALIRDANAVLRASGITAEEFASVPEAELQMRAALVKSAVEYADALRAALKEPK